MGGLGFAGGEFFFEFFGGPVGEFLNFDFREIGEAFRDNMFFKPAVLAGLADGCGEVSEMADIAGGGAMLPLPAGAGPCLDDAPAIPVGAEIRGRVFVAPVIGQRAICGRDRPVLADAEILAAE